MVPTLAREAGRFANKADLKKKPKQPKHHAQSESESKPAASEAVDDEME